MSEVVLEKVEKRFGDRAVVSGVSLTIPSGSLLALLGPSGCGKTTTLRMVAGHERPDAGRILVDGRDVTDVPPERRDVGMVFQSYALFPHLTVFGNVAFGLRTRKVGREEERERVAAALALVGLAGTGTRGVGDLSGGEQQRVALARALVLRPRVLLLDEPLSNLDAALRVSTRGEIRRIQREAGVTTLYVTHDQEEALAIADRVAVMDAGRIRREGAPDEVYRDPGDPFTAGFLGEANVLPARVVDGSVVVGDGLEVTVTPAPPGPGEVLVSIRREEVRLVPGDAARVIDRQFLGGAWLVRLEAAGVTLIARHPSGAGEPPASGEKTGIQLSGVRVVRENRG